MAVIRKPTATGPIQTYFIHADHLNTPRVIVNQGNNAVWRSENSHAFGSNLPDEDPDGNSQLFEYHPRFPGQYFDKETNLHYNYFRYYEPETGRYISPDPIGLAGGLNVYGYVLQNPLSYTDPDGLVAPDALIDLVLIAYDLASLAYNKLKDCDTSLDEASLAANVTGLLIPGATGLGLGVRAASKGEKATRPSLSAHKEALKKIQEEVGKLPKSRSGKFGSPQAGNSKKGYRLDPPHDGAVKGSAESKYHFNWWDYSNGKRGNGGRSGAIPIGD